MSKEQIEEMARALCRHYNTAHCKVCDHHGKCHVRLEAEWLYSEGYRKQSEGEWIRYPHNSGIYCSLCKRKRRYRDINDAYCPHCGAKMKGGERQ